MANKSGEAAFTLPEGNYHFRADQYDLPFWSGADNHCEVPGCQEAVISTYAFGNDPRQEQEIVYTYDALNLLTAAEYSSGIYFRYTYDGAGNRLSQEVGLDGEPVVTSYAYDDANHLIQVGEQIFTLGANGNLLNEGAKQYGYEAANSLLQAESLTYSWDNNGYLFRRDAVIHLRPYQPHALLSRGGGDQLLLFQRPEWSHLSGGGRRAD